MKKSIIITVIALISLVGSSIAISNSDSDVVVKKDDTKEIVSISDSSKDEKDSSTKEEKVSTVKDKTSSKEDTSSKTTTTKKDEGSTKKTENKKSNTSTKKDTSSSKSSTTSSKETKSSSTSTKQSSSTQDVKKETPKQEASTSSSNSTSQNQEVVQEPVVVEQPSTPTYACPGGVNQKLACDVILDSNYYYATFSSESEAAASGEYYLNEVMYIGETEITNYSIQPVYRNDHNVAYYGLNLWSNGSLIQ